ncbi:hypothetical protein [Stutzerimonas nitrititolerans]|uniref:hypothetical protein n=1 Tax=Stutzerimonas nitrititolerans TaxID=2482751 RepID=UPI002899AB9C|nr:hypothetical protein [Stutzerimonas nitrititolerans]
MSNSLSQPRDAGCETPFKELLQLAAGSGRDVTVITEILQFIDAHPQLIDFPRIIQGLLNALNEMEKPPVLFVGDFDLMVWRHECHWIISNRSNPRFISALGPRYYFGDDTRRRNPIIGQGVQDHAFPYATLWHEPTDVDGAPDYYRLLGQLLVAHQESSGALELRGQRYNAYLKLRTLCAQEILTIPAELNIWSSPAIFMQSCRVFDPSISIDIYAEAFPAVTRLVRYCGGDEPPERRGGGNYRRGTSGRTGLGVLVSQGVTRFALDDPDDPDLLPGHISFVVPQLDHAFDEAFPEGEITAPDELCLIDTGTEVRPFVAELLSHQGILAHIARNRQFLPFGYNLLTLSELANLLFNVTDEFLRCRERIRTAPLSEQVGIRTRMEALLALHLMLWFGRSLEDCKKLQIAEGRARPRGPFELIPASGLEPAEFRFLVPTPDYAAEEQLPPGTVRKAGSAVSVPDMVGAAKLVLEVRALASMAGTAVFTRKVKEVESEARVLLKELGGGDPRYTVHKIRSYLHRQIITDTHDVVAATMLSGLPCLSANTAIYYTQYSANHLRSLYCRSVQNVLAAIYGTVGLEAPVTNVVGASEVAVGARNCLKLSAVKNNLEALLAVLRKRPRKVVQELVHWHNCLTLWTILMFLMATACRAIRNPLKAVEEFEQRSGHGALGDKGADDGHMSRLVVMPELLRRQLEAYDAHCCAIRVKLKYRLPAQTPCGSGFFLRLADDNRLSYEEIRPSHIDAYMRQVVGFTPHPVNGFRKLMRTELAERGCPPETLAAFMGHWLHGEAPQEMLSSFCPGAYVQSLHAYLLPLMRELGWMVRNSHLVKEAK